MRTTPPKPPTTGALLLDTIRLAQAETWQPHPYQCPGEGALALCIGCAHPLMVPHHLEHPDPAQRDPERMARILEALEGMRPRPAIVRGWKPEPEDTVGTDE